ncbi:hypothetical protein PYCC9005_000824 [Savitreella phatthalungensis]
MTKTIRERDTATGHVPRQTHGQQQEQSQEERPQQESQQGVRTREQDELWTFVTFLTLAGGLLAVVVTETDHMVRIQLASLSCCSLWIFIQYERVWTLRPVRYALAIVVTASLGGVILIFVVLPRYIFLGIVQYFTGVLHYSSTFDLHFFLFVRFCFAIFGPSQSAERKTRKCNMELFGTFELILDEGTPRVTGIPGAWRLTAMQITHLDWPALWAVLVGCPERNFSSATWRYLASLGRRAREVRLSVSRENRSERKREVALTVEAPGSAGGGTERAASQLVQEEFVDTFEMIEQLAGQVATSNGFCIFIRNSLGSQALPQFQPGDFDLLRSDLPVLLHVCSSADYVGPVSDLGMFAVPADFFVTWAASL